MPVLSLVPGAFERFLKWLVVTPLKIFFFVFIGVLLCRWATPVVSVR